MSLSFLGRDTAWSLKYFARGHNWNYIFVLGAIKNWFVKRPQDDARRLGQHFGSWSKCESGAYSGAPKSSLRWESSQGTPVRLGDAKSKFEKKNTNQVKPRCKKDCLQKNLRTQENCSPKGYCTKQFQSHFFSSSSSDSLSMMGGPSVTSSPNGLRVLQCSVLLRRKRNEKNTN